METEILTVSIIICDVLKKSNISTNTNTGERSFKREALLSSYIRGS